jgi:dipeptidyl aminopeptidase/acylaminoacyl peptidase
VAYRRKPGYTRIVTYVRSSPSDQLQPLTETRNYTKPGDVLDVNQPVLFDVATGRQTFVDNSLFPNPYQISRVEWWEDSRAFTFEYNQRGHEAYRVLEVDGNTGVVRALISEEVPTFFAYRNATAGLSDTGHKYIQPIDDGREILWMSQRDNWAHLYLYDGVTGRVKNQVTKGAWTLSAIDSVDVENRQIYFQARGMNPGQDPYFPHFYRINFDGSGLLEYTQGNGYHAIYWSPDRQYYVDTYSRVDMPPVMELHRGSDGEKLAELERGDMSAMLATGWQPPEVFVSKGRDGETDIWGILVRPLTFDPAIKYPVIEQIYAGPQGSFVPKTWGGGQSLLATAELGFVLVQIDGMGTNNRSKAFHDVAFKDLGDAGFPDRILWHQAVAEKYAWYDISRVGLYGGSAGGQNAMGGVLFHGDFYDAAFASSGCHDNRMDKIWWNEHWMSWPLGPHYEASSNVVNAHKLTGKLFLAVGEMDTNVDPSSTMQVVDALIRAGKTFDLLVVPNGGHGATGLNGTRKRNDFFVKSLWGIDPPDWNSGISLGLDEEGGPIMEPDFDIEPPPGFFEDPGEDPPYTWW